MLTERDRKILASMEQRIRAQDPELARAFERGFPRLTRPQAPAPAGRAPLERDGRVVRGATAGALVVVVLLGYIGAMLADPAVMLACLVAVPLVLLVVALSRRAARGAGNVDRRARPPVGGGEV